MNRKAVIILAAVLVIGVIAGGWLIVRSLPEYALYEMSCEIRRDGIDAVDSHLTEALRKPYRKIMDAVYSPLAKLVKVIGSSGNSEIAKIVDQFSSLEWNLKGVERGSGSATATLSVGGEDFSGNVDLLMKRIGGKWLIDNISLPGIGWVM